MRVWCRRKKVHVRYLISWWVSCQIWLAYVAKFGSVPFGDYRGQRLDEETVRAKYSGLQCISQGWCISVAVTVLLLHDRITTAATVWVRWASQAFAHSAPAGPTNQEALSKSLQTVSTLYSPEVCHCFWGSHEIRALWTQVFVAVFTETTWRCPYFVNDLRKFVSNKN